jgi:chemotaxis protein CheD
VAVKTFSNDAAAPARDRLDVGVSEYRVAADGETLVAYGLGACVAIGLYDPGTEVAGLAHTLLPRAEEGIDGAEAKFVDAAIEGTLREMIEAGADYDAVQAWVVGGARIFDLKDLDLPRGVGQRGVDVAHERLAELNVPVVDEAVGGDHGRTVELDAETGELRVFTAEDEAPTTLAK